MIKWIYVKTIEAMGSGFSVYVSEDNTIGKNIWFDGYEEVYHIA
jgi:hypothetical protein